MIRKNRIWLVALTPLLFAGVALADEENACSEPCPSGQVRVGFADGDHANCSCLPEGAGMTDVVAEPGGEPQPGDS